jgi:predicted Mrr-cat superfamily restriction endonuclease
MRQAVPQTVWVVRAGGRGQHLAEFRAQGLVALPAYGCGDITSLTPDQIRESVIATGGGVARHAAMLGMLREMRIWDGVLTPDPRTGAVWCGRITREYRYLPDRIPGLPHTRSVKWIAPRWRAQLSPRLIAVLDAGMAVFKPAAQEHLRILDVWVGEEAETPR